MCSGFGFGGTRDGVVLLAAEDERRGRPGVLLLLLLVVPEGELPPEEDERRRRWVWNDREVKCVLNEAGVGLVRYAGRKGNEEGQPTLEIRGEDCGSLGSAA